MDKNTLDTFLICAQVATMVSGIVAFLNLIKRDKNKTKQILEMSRLVDTLEKNNIEQKIQSESLQGQLDVMKENLELVKKHLDIKKEQIENSKIEKLKNVEPYFTEGNKKQIILDAFNTEFINTGKDKARILDIEIVAEESNINTANSNIRDTNKHIIDKNIEVRERFNIGFTYISNVEHPNNVVFTLLIMFENIYGNRYSQRFHISQRQIKEDRPNLIA